MEVWKFESWAVEEVSFIEEKDVYLVFLDEVQKLRAFQSDALEVQKENSGISHRD